jgi:enoyl-CoA hydratase/carnithine racemase
VLVTLNRSERANAYTTEMLRALYETVLRARRDGTRALVITGSGDNFCSGADRNELEGRGAMDGLHLFSREVFDALSDAPFPVIAAINGPAVGGGLELAMTADLRICGPRAVFKLPEVSLGLAPAAGGMRRLLAEVGPARMKEIVMFGRALDASTALSWGLVAAVAEHPASVAIDKAEEVSNSDELCVAVIKRLANGAASAGKDAEAVAQALLYERRGSAVNT